MAILASRAVGAAEGGSPGHHVALPYRPLPPPDCGLEQYLGNVMQVGLLVVLAVGAGALASDQPIERAAFYRSRIRRVWMLLAPRVAVVTLATVVAPTQSPRLPRANATIFESVMANSWLSSSPMV
jgi:hypothetical protein